MFPNKTAITAISVSNKAAPVLKIGVKPEHPTQSSVFFQSFFFA